jgi:hypothetical protein
MEKQLVSRDLLPDCSLFREIFENLPEVSCVVNKSNLNIIFVNELFSEKIVNSCHVLGQNFIVKILSKKGAVDFTDTLSTMEKNNLKHAVAERVETMAFQQSGEGGLIHNVHCVGFTD